jgi:hypothetical protein
VFHVPGDAYSLICELAQPVPIPLRDRFVRRVQALLAGDAILSPGKIVEASARAQAELMIAPPTAEPATVRPTRSQPPRGPFRPRA